MNKTLGISNILRCFDSACVGTRVFDKDMFLRIVANALCEYTFPENGQGFVPLPDDACAFCLGGVAYRPGLRPEDYVVREWREQVDLFAARRHAAPVVNVACIVYTMEAYKADPQVRQEEFAMLLAQGCTHVLVAVLASGAGPKPQVSPGRLAENMAGGNARYEWLWCTKARACEDAAGLASCVNTLGNDVKAVAAYAREWVTVAD